MQTCPNGHELPHVLVSGARCSPLDCAELELVEKQQALAPKGPGSAEELQVSLMAELNARKAAWDALHPLPRVAEPEVSPTHPEYVQRRLKQVKPLALERRIRRAIHDPGKDGEEAASELLDRAGHTRKPEGDINFNGPVVVVNMPPSKLPWTTGKGLVDGTVVSGEEVDHDEGETP